MTKHTNAQYLIDRKNVTTAPNASPNRQIVFSWHSFYSYFYIYKMIRYFAWDEAKARENQRKHGVSFKAAAQVFDDPLCRTVQDRIEGAEHRWQTIGMVEGCLLLLVAHTVNFREGENKADNLELIRLISARRATKQERKRYENAQI